MDLSALLIVNPFLKVSKNESVRFHDSKLKLVKALLFRSFHETEASTAGFCSAFICACMIKIFRGGAGVVTPLNPLPLRTTFAFTYPLF